MPRAARPRFAAQPRFLVRSAKDEALAAPSAFDEPFDGLRMTLSTGIRTGEHFDKPFDGLRMALSTAFRRTHAAGAPKRRCGVQRLSTLLRTTPMRRSEASLCPGDLC